MTAMEDELPPEAEALPEELLEHVKPELQPGESLLWAAEARPRPAPAQRFPYSAALVAASFGALSGGCFFAIFGRYRPVFLALEGLMTATGVISAIVGIVAGIIAVAIMIEHWSSGAPGGPRVYALTNRRAIIWVPRQDSTAVEIFTVSPGSLRSIHRVEYPDGSGDVRFDFPSEDHHFAIGGFDGVIDVRRVEELARETLLASSNHGLT